jgi:hypothetical protein
MEKNAIANYGEIVWFVVNQGRGLTKAIVLKYLQYGAQRFIF